MKSQQLANENIKNDDKTIVGLAADIQKIREKICNVFLITFAVIAIPALTASLYRITVIGWQPVMVAHVTIAMSLWGIVIFRNKISYNIQASFIVIMFLIIGLGGIYQFGLIAGSIAFLVISSPIATLLFGVKIGIATLAIALSGSAVIGLLIVSGNLQHELDLPAYAIASSSWFNSIIGWGLASTALTTSLYVFNKKLIHALAISKQNQEDIQLSKERLNMVLEGGEQGFWDWNIDTDEVKRNDRWAQMLGYTTIKEFEDNTDTWTNSIYPDDRDAAWKSINDHLEGRTTSHKLEYRMLTKDGGIKWILDHAKVVQHDSSGRPTRMSGTHTDISEQKKMEEELRSAKQNLDEVLKESITVVYRCEATGDYPATFISENIKRQLGYEPEQFTKDPGFWANHIHPDDRNHVFSNLGVLFENGYHSHEYRFLNGHGDYIWMHDELRLIKDDNGQTKDIIGNWVDITKRKQAEYEKENLHRELQQSQKMEALGKLTGGIAHEYNNMLAIIIGFSELLKSPLIKQPKLLKYANEIQHAGNRAAKLTSKLLTFSRQKISEADSLYLNDLLHKLQHMLEKTLTVRINLIFNLQENLWQVWLDEGDLEDAILNMSINAMHAIEGNGQLTIKTNNQKINQMSAQSLGIEPGDYVLLSFTDTGCGIDKETKEKIFDPFFTTKGEKGTGLGLSMVYGFVQGSGGVIKVNSELDQGAQFTLYFPRYYGSSRVQQLPADNPVESFINNKTILVVDDESSLLDLTNEILSSHGFKVFCAESAKEALSILQHETIDMLISDVIMPEMDGYQLAAIVKEKYPEIKIQLASGFTDDHNMDMVDKHLQNNVLHKPFSSQELVLRIRELCNGNTGSSISS